MFSLIANVIIMFRSSSLKYFSLANIHFLKLINYDFETYKRFLWGKNKRLYFVIFQKK
jgi:hypothetical protein